MKQALTRQQALIALNLIPSIGRSSVASLLSHFDDPRDVFIASEEELGQVEGLNSKKATAICEFDFGPVLEQELLLIDRLGVKIVALDDEDYPVNLKNIYDPPPFLYVKGELKGVDQFAIALVGARKCSKYGKTVATDLAGQLVGKGMTVVSGMARGIDTASHKGALKAEGRTIAVLGCGLSVIYPPENHELMEQIAENGAVISEFPITTAPSPYNFPVRNRIISGLSLGVVVVEANKRSGSSITVACALEQGRECFAVPGSINSPYSRGAHHHIKQGAKLVENVDDILEELQPQLVGLMSPSINIEANNADTANFEVTAHEQKILDILSYDPVYVDDVTMNSEFSPQQVLGLLMSLEMKNKVAQHPGQMYSLT